MGKHFKPDIKLEVITKYFNNEASLNMLSKEYNIPGYLISFYTDYFFLKSE